MNQHLKGSYCSYCGDKFAEQKLWPRKCFVCYNESYSNPVPCSAALIQAYQQQYGQEVSGILIQRRNIQPHKGEWALPSGYMDVGETWQESCAREVEEEMGLRTQPGEYQLVEVVNGSTGNLVIFGRYKHVVSWEEINFQPNAEVTEIRLARMPEELAFPTHTSNLARCLSSK